MVVIPPGMDFSNVVALADQEPAEADGDLAALINGDGNLSPRALPPIWSEVMRFFTNRHKPMILALSRPDPKKKSHDSSQSIWRMSAFERAGKFDTSNGKQR